MEDQGMKHLIKNKISYVMCHWSPVHIEKRGVNFMYTNNNTMGQSIIYQ